MIRFLTVSTLIALALAGCRAEPPVPAEREAAAAQPAPAAVDSAPTVPLTIESANGDHVFQVELARTSNEQRRGLMFRTSLAPDHGMLFPFPDVRPASFWMRNTLIPLDMIFIREDGTIANIVHEAEPYTLDPRESEGPVSAVLEIAGGRAAALGIEAGDTVSWEDAQAGGASGALADAN